MSNLVKTKYFKLFYAVAVNLVFLALCLLFVEQKYDMADSSQYPIFIYDGYYTFGFLNYFFCVICGAVQSLVYPISAYVVLQVVFSFFALTAISLIFLQKYHFAAATFAIALLNSCYSVFQYTNISFTVYPALLGVAGILCIIHFSRQKKWLAGVIAGVILLMLNVLFRYEVTEVVVFIGVFYVIGLSLTEYFGLERNRRKVKEFFLILFEPKRFFSFLVAVGFCFALFFVSHTIDNATPELKYFNEYTHARSAVWDYEIPSYDTCPEKYAALGLDENDIELFRKGYMDDQGATPLSVLKGMREIQQEYNAENRSVADVLKSMISAVPANIGGKIEPIMGYFSFGLTVLLMLVFMKTRRLLIPLFLGIPMLCLLYHLHNIGRTPYRTVHMIWISVLVYMLYSYSRRDLRDCFKRQYQSRRKTAVILLLVISVVMSPVVFYVSKIARFTISTYSAEDNTADLRKYVEEHPDMRFVFSRSSGLTAVDDNVHYIVKKDPDNTVTFTATYYRYDWYEDKLEKFGCRNLYEGLLEKDVYWIDGDASTVTESMKEYLQKHYSDSKQIVVNKIDSYSGQSVYKFERR